MRTRYLAWIRGPLLPIGIGLIVAGVFSPVSELAPLGAVLILTNIALQFVRTEQPDRAPIPVAPPVRGRWLAINGPADAVPSHGTRAFGQAYAIDLLYQPDQTPWRAVHRWPPARRPAKFPGFGQPVLAPAAGVVVKASGWQRDHWSRNSWLGLAYLYPEMLIRAALSGYGGQLLLGNHLILDCGDGVYAALAHLRKGSIRVRAGQRVSAGDPLAEVGNSGNTSEPHLHFQLMDHPRAPLAAGLPFSFNQYEMDGVLHSSGLPDSSSPFTVDSGESKAG